MIAALLLAACGTGPRALTWRESWEMLGLDATGAVFEARFTRGNTGLLRGQGHVSVSWAARHETPVRYRRDAAPWQVRVHEQGMEVGPDSLLPWSGRWRMSVRAGEMDAALLLTPWLPGPPARTWELAGGRGTVDPIVVAGALQGELRAGRRGGTVDGVGLLVHRRGDAGPGPRGSRQVGVYVLGTGLAAGIDQQGSRAISWAVVGDRSLDPRDARLVRLAGGGMDLDFRPAAPLVLRVLPVAPHLRRSPWDHLLPVEDQLARACFGLPERRLRAARVETSWQGSRRSARALVAVTEWR